MSLKNRDEHNRWRNKTIAFRVSPEENEQIERYVKIDMGFTALAIAERVGHESIDITYRYTHLFPTRQVEMADKLDLLKNEKGV